MEIKEGQLLEVDHEESGKWIGRATRDFDTRKENFLPLTLAQEKSVELRNGNLKHNGETMSALNGFCTIKKI
jgi:hypothetical protein